MVKKKAAVDRLDTKDVKLPLQFSKMLAVLLLANIFCADTWAGGRGGKGSKGGGYGLNLDAGNGAGYNLATGALEAATVNTVSSSKLYGGNAGFVDDGAELAREGGVITGQDGAPSVYFGRDGTPLAGPDIFDPAGYAGGGLGSGGGGGGDGIVLTKPGEVTVNRAVKAGNGGGNPVASSYTVVNSSGGSGGEGGQGIVMMEPGTLTIGSGISAIGGDGGHGGKGESSTSRGQRYYGGDGGDGGSGIVLVNGGTLVAEPGTVIRGGNGGEGGSVSGSVYFAEFEAGSGGRGGSAVVLAEGGTLILGSGASVKGGDAGKGGDSGPFSIYGGDARVGDGGIGGSAIVAEKGGRLVIGPGAVVRGGAAGAVGASLQDRTGGRTDENKQNHPDGWDYAEGNGRSGYAIVGSNLSILSAGAIQDGDLGQSSRAASIYFSGRRNSLELQPGWSMIGSVSGAKDVTSTLILGGDRTQDAATPPMVFDVQAIDNGQLSFFSSVKKTGTSTWTLQGINGSGRARWEIAEGTLIASARSFGAGGLQNDATLIIDQPAGDYLLPNVLSGSGSFTKQGPGLVTLANVNSHTGPMTIADGTLAGTEKSFGSGAIRNDGTLVINQTSKKADFFNTISGSGSFTKRGAGELTLADVNSYSGGTRLIGGALSGKVGSFGSGPIEMSTVDRLQRSELIIEESGNGVFANDVKGPGALTKQGSGTLLLTGNNSYTGLTLVNEGILIGSTTSIGSGVVFVRPETQLVLDQAIDSSFPHVMFGEGTLVKRGDARLFLSGEKTYQGGTIISAGTLVGSSSSFGSGRILNNAALVIDQAESDEYFLNPVLGTGTLTKTGSKLLILAYSSIYSGGTTIAEGILAGSAKGFGSGPIRNDATLVIVQDANAALTNAISGRGVFVKQGKAILTLAGQNSYSGGTVVWSGTLAGSSSSFGSGPIVINGKDAALLLNQPTDATLNNAISGNGTLTKSGAGVLTLTAANYYTGRTSLSGGMLVLAASNALGETSGLVVDNGAIAQILATTSQSVGALHTRRGGRTIVDGDLVIADGQRDSAVAIGGVLSANTLSGSGAFVIDPSLVYSDGAQPDYTGRLTLTGGSRLMVNAADAYANASAIVLATPGDALVFGDESGHDPAWTAIPAGTVRTPVVGVGTVEVNDGSSLLLAADNSDFSGTFSIDARSSRQASRLTVSAASQLGQADIRNQGIFIAQADPGADWTLDNQLSGSGSFFKTGAGRLTFSGDGSRLSGASVVQDGVLTVTGSLVSSPVTVAANAVLMGSGKVGGINALSGATVAPGLEGAIGTLTASGNLVFEEGSIYRLAVRPEAASQITVAGEAHLAGGMVAITVGEGIYRTSSRYPIVSAVGGVTGKFFGVTQVGGRNLDFLRPVASYRNGSEVTLSFARNDRKLSSVVRTPNQKAVADSIDTMDTDAPLPRIILNMDAARIAEAFGQLSGEIHASARNMLIDDGRIVREAILDRLRPEACDTPDADLGEEHSGSGGACSLPKFKGWAQVLDSRGRGKGDSRDAGFSRVTNGILLGIDGSASYGWTTGALLGYTHTTFADTGSAGSGNSDAYHLGVYAGNSWGSWALRAGFTYALSKLTTTRQVNVPGIASGLKAGYGARTAQLFSELGYRWKAGAIAIEPFAGLAYVRLSTNGFEEQGGAAALSGKQHHAPMTFAMLGLKAASDIELGGKKAMVSGIVGRGQAFGAAPEAKLSFGPGSSVFGVTGVPYGKNAMAMKFSMEMALTRQSSLNVAYSGQFSGNITDRSARIAIRYQF